MVVMENLTNKTVAAHMMTSVMLMGFLIITSPIVLANPYENPKSIKAAVVSFLNGRIETGTKHQIELGKLDPRLRLTKCSETLETFFLNGTRAYSSTTIGVKCQSPKPWTIFVPAKVKIFENVLASTQALARGDKIDTGLFKYVSRDITQLPTGYYLKSEEILGKLVKRPLRAGAVFTPTLLESPRLISRGEIVTIIAEKGSFQVRATGEALMDGIENQTIKVRNKASKKVIEGIVSAPGLVKVRM